MQRWLDFWCCCWCTKPLRRELWSVWWFWWSGCTEYCNTQDHRMLAMHTGPYTVIGKEAAVKQRHFSEHDNYPWNVTLIQSGKSNRALWYDNCILLMYVRSQYEACVQLANFHWIERGAVSELGIHFTIFIFPFIVKPWPILLCLLLSYHVNLTLTLTSLIIHSLRQSTQPAKTTSTRQPEAEKGRSCVIVE